MYTPSKFDAALEAWWKEDGAQARVSNTYSRHGLPRAQAAEACLDDYEAGLIDARAQLEAGRQPSEKALVQAYEKRLHGERIDVFSYRLGIRRMVKESTALVSK